MKNQKPRYDQHGNMINDKDYYQKKYEKEIDFYEFFKVIGFAAGICFIYEIIHQLFIK